MYTPRRKQSTVFGFIPRTTSVVRQISDHEKHRTCTQDSEYAGLYCMHAVRVCSAQAVNNAANADNYLLILLLCALASGAVYCNRSCLCVCVFVAGGGRVGDDCYHDNSKLRASIFTKLGL